MQISRSVRAVQVPDDNPMHPMYTTMYLVGKAGRGEVLTIDSGEAMDRYKWMLRGYLAATEQSEIALAGITHHHADHSGNLKWVNETLKAKVLLHETAVPILRKQKLLPKMDVVETMGDDDVIDLGGGVRPEVIFTPGHSVDSICYYLQNEGVLFTGDTLLGSSTTTVNELGPYRESLKMLSELPNLKVICPGHGAIVYDPRERLLDLIKHREMRDRQILDALGTGAPLSAWDIMMKIYPASLDKRLRRAAARNVQSHLVQFQDEGRLTELPGRRRRPNERKQQREVEHAKYRESIIKQAKKLETEQHRAQLRAMESPPDAEWSTPPKYQLVGTVKGARR